PVTRIRWPASVPDPARGRHGESCASTCERSDVSGWEARRQGRLHHRRGPRPGAVARRPAGPGGRGHHRGRHLRPDRQRGLPDGHARGPGRNSQRGRGAGPADRRAAGRRKDEAGLRAAFEAGVAELGPVDIVLANAGIAPMSLGEEPHEAWQDVIDVNLTGVFNTVEIAIPSMIERGAGGAIVLTSSTAGITGIGGSGRGGLGYTASKHGVVGLMRAYANYLAPHRIRVNSVHPTGVNTPMVVNDIMQAFLESDPSLSQAMANALPVDMVEPV